MKFTSNSLASVASAQILSGRAMTFVLIFMAFVMLSVSLVTPAVFGGVRTTVSDAVAPVFAYAVRPFQNAMLYLRDVSGLAHLQATNTELKKENLKLKEWYQRALVLESENKSLRTLLNYSDEPNRRYITGRILSDSNGDYAHTLLVMAGQNNGVKENQAAIAPEGLIGRIVEAGDKTSRILLVKDMNSRVPVLIENTGHHAILAGDNSAYPKLTHLPATHDIRKGVRIVTSGYGGVYPPGIPIGRVMFEDGQEVPSVELFTDFSRLVHVRMIETL